MEQKSDSVLVCVRFDRCCNRYWRCFFCLGLVISIFVVLKLLTRSSDSGPLLETNWQKHWSESQHSDSGHRLVFEPVGNAVNARQESVDQYVANEKQNPESDGGEYYDKDEAAMMRSDYDQQYRYDVLAGRQNQARPGSMGIISDIHDYSLRSDFKFIFNTSVKEEIVFDENYVNPCWAEKIPTLPYRNNFYLKVKDNADALEASFKYMRQLFLKRSDLSNHWRLRCLPYFYIMETPPMATPRLYNALRFHPFVINPEVVEPEFWNEKGPGGLATLQDYLDLFDAASESIRNSTTSVMKDGTTVLKHKRITGDGTSSYLWMLNSWQKILGNAGESEPKVTAADMIKRFTPNAKVIMVLRNPTERLFQGYLQRTDNPSAADFHDRTGKAMTSLSECEKKRSVRSCVYDAFLNQRQLVRLRIGMYYPFVNDWISVFGREQVKVIRYEDYVTSPSEVINDVCSFLGIPPYATKDLESMEFLVKDMERKRKEKEKLKMLSATRQMLKEFHRKLNRQLADLLGDEKFTWPEMSDDSDLQRPQQKESNEKNQQQDRERQDRERQDRERQDRERQDRERQDRERQDRERQDRERQDRERQDRERLERERQIKEQQLRQQNEEQVRIKQQREQQLREEMQRRRQQQLQRAQQSQQQGQRFQQQQGQQNQWQEQQNQQALQRRQQNQ